MIDLDAFAQRHIRRYGERPRLFAAPGRVNIIGEHTDYNDGFVLPMAIDRHIVVASSALAEPLLRVYSEALDESATIELFRPFQREGSWRDYVAAVAYASATQTPLQGLCLSIGGDLPIGAGLASSAALEIALAMALYERTCADIEQRVLAAIGTRAEHDYVGIRSGVMDQLVCVLAKTGNALLIDCRSLEATAVPLPDAAGIVVCDTRVKHALAASAYNDRRASCELGVHILRESGMEIIALRDVSPQEFERVQQRLPTVVRERCRHVVYENARTLDASAALRAGDLVRTGALLNDSHDSLARLYQVSSAELDEVVYIARSVDGVYGARMTGAGFGGSAIALIQPQAFDCLRNALRERYYEPRGLEPGVFGVKAVAGAHKIAF
jgi:galactokinase